MVEAWRWAERDLAEVSSKWSIKDIAAHAKKHSQINLSADAWLEWSSLSEVEVGVLKKRKR